MTSKTNPNKLNVVKYPLVVLNFFSDILSAKQLEEFQNIYGFQYSFGKNRVIMDANLHFDNLREFVVRELSTTLLHSEYGKKYFLNYNDMSSPFVELRKKFVKFDLENSVMNLSQGLFFNQFIERMHFIGLKAYNDEGIIKIYGFEELRQVDEKKYLESIKSLIRYGWAYNFESEGYFG